MTITTRTLIETMPASLCASHVAARNWGSYPANGAQRVVVDGDGADHVTDNGYDRAIRPATPADEQRWGDAPSAEYRAHDTVTGWQGPPRDDVDVAAADADAHNDGCAEQGGYGSALVVVRDGDRCVDLDGQPVWPSHGRTSGAARWT